MKVRLIIQFCFGKLSLSPVSKNGKTQLLFMRVRLHIMRSCVLAKSYMMHTVFFANVCLFSYLENAGTI